jgi:malonate-semialdehyde dehydrogenase (acetylating) / methylmalonate-semialdehyde dehydrogenase
MASEQQTLQPTQGQCPTWRYNQQSTEFARVDVHRADTGSVYPMNRLENYIAGEWKVSETSHHLEIVNPATTEVLAEVPLSSSHDLGQAVQAAEMAFISWRRVPPAERIQFLFKLKSLLEDDKAELAQLITQECGKTLAESTGELQRAIENVETACGIPTFMQGYNSEDIARGIDEMMIRQPLGVVGIIAPFNFPAMIPFWFFPYAIACGNTCVIKPSEKVPLTMQRIMTLIAQTDLPAGVINLVNGSQEVVNAMLDHPAIRAISFVGSSPVAQYIYSRAAAQGKRVQCQGGAKNPVVILPDADLEMTTRILADSAFGCAGQRCLAASLAITVGSAKVPGASRGWGMVNGLPNQHEGINSQNADSPKASLGEGGG